MMGAAHAWLPWLRIPLLLVLLVVAGQYMESMKLAASRLQAGPAWATWAVVALASVAFVAVVLAGRQRRQPAALLGVEALVAAVIALSPPFEWLRLFGFSTWPTAMVAGPAQPLATAWLGVVCLHVFRRSRAMPDDRPPVGADPAA